jgi:hypothetical protein
MRVQGCGSGFGLDPDSMILWIQIRIRIESIRIHNPVRVDMELLKFLQIFIGSQRYNSLRLIRSLRSDFHRSLNQLRFEKVVNLFSKIIGTIYFNQR